MLNLHPILSNLNSEGPIRRQRLSKTPTKMAKPTTTATSTKASVIRKQRSEETEGAADA